MHHLISIEKSLVDEIILSCYFSAIYDVYVEDFMITDIKYICLGMNYINLRDLLIKNKKITAFPLVDSPQTMTLLGSIPRTELIRLLDQQMGATNRRQILPSPRIFRHDENEEPVEIIPMRKKSHVPIIDDSSDSEKEEDKNRVTKMRFEEFKLEAKEAKEAREDVKELKLPVIEEPKDKKVRSFSKVMRLLMRHFYYYLIL